MNKKNIFLISLGVFLIGFFLYALATDFNFYTLANDSGFDTSYDGGGYSGDGDGGSIFYLIYLALQYPLLTLIIVIIAVITTIYEKGKRRSYNNNLNYQFIDNQYAAASSKEILKQTYQIFYEVQMAWMNFDYNRLRELVSDELYNMYYNQLQTMQLKGQRNIMEGFKINNIRLVNAKEENGVIEYCIDLKVSFFDYVVDANGRVVRGRRGAYNTMYYLLTYASSSVKLEFCPNCSAPLPENSICEYCHSHIQGLRQMRLVKKINVKQERVD